jgi:hypothetical protein
MKVGKQNKQKNSVCVCAYVAIFFSFFPLGGVAFLFLFIYVGSCEYFYNWVLKNRKPQTEPFFNRPSQARKTTKSQNGG